MMPVQTPLHSLLKLSCKIKVVDVGASPIDGPPPYAPLLAAGHTHVVGFEPNREALAALQGKQGPNETYLPVAVGDGKQHKLKICAAPGMSSLMDPNPDVLRLFHGFSEWGRVLRTEDISTVRLDDVAETDPMDYLKIDIQGAELMVLQNAIQRLAKTLIIHTEVEFLPMYRGQPLFSDVDAFLRSHGFVLHRFQPLTSRAVRPLVIDNNAFAGFGQLFWADAVFIRDFVDLAPLNPDQLIRSAVILHDCYLSFDLVFHLLSEYDRRTGESHARRYRTLLTKHPRISSQ